MVVVVVVERIARVITFGPAETVVRRGREKGSERRIESTRMEREIEAS